MLGIGLINLILIAIHKTLLLPMFYIGGDRHSRPSQVLVSGLIQPRSEAWEGPFVTQLGLVQSKRASSRMEAGTSVSGLFKEVTGN